MLGRQEVKRRDRLFVRRAKGQEPGRKKYIYRLPYILSLEYYSALLINLWSDFPHRLTNDICVVHALSWHARATRAPTTLSLVRTAWWRSWNRSNICLHLFLYRFSVGYCWSLWISLWSARGQTARSLIRTSRKRSWAGSKTCIHEFPYRLSVGYYSAILINLWSAFPHRLTNEFCVFHALRWHARATGAQSTLSLVRTAWWRSWNRSNTCLHLFLYRFSVGYCWSLLISLWSAFPYRLTNNIYLFLSHIDMLGRHMLQTGVCVFVRRAKGREPGRQHVFTNFPTACP